ncbi:MAG: hypothetical protein GX465_17725 [Acidobacteria bacterium]|nr:hypothetical protein [Acidobacteriota bacterium]
MSEPSPKPIIDLHTVVTKTGETFEVEVLPTNEEKAQEEEARRSWVARCQTEFSETTARHTIRLRYADIAAYLRDRFHVIPFNGKAFVYHPDRGTYHEDKGELNQVIRDIAETVDYKESLTKAIREVLAYVMSYDVYRDYPFNQAKDIIPVKNGVVKIDYESGTASLLPHSPEHRITFALPVVYDPDASGDTFHKEVIGQYVDPETVDVLYMIPAIALLQSQGTKPYKKAFILQGDANAGKTTYLEWLTRLFGPENISRASLQQVTQDRFINGVIEGKLFNAFDDLSDVPLETVGQFKALTGGFDHQVERKHANPYQSRIFAVHCFSCNAPPDVPEKVVYDGAFWERWEYINFLNIFDTDTGFNDRAFTEENISGSFNAIIEMMIKIRRSGMPINSTASEVKQAWQIAADPFAKFLFDHTVSLLPSQEPWLFNKAKLLASFQDYCQKTNISERKIPRTLKALSTMAFKNGFKDVKRGPAKERKYFYEAPRRWKEDSPYAKTVQQEMTDDTTLEGV